MTKKIPRLTEDLQKDLLDKPLRCLEGVSFGSMTMNEGIEVMARIAEEINGYLDTSPVAQTLARQLVARNKKLANLSISFDREIGVEIEPKTPTKKKTKKVKTRTKEIQPSKPIIPPVTKQEPMVQPTSLELELELEDTSEIDLLFVEATKKKISLKGVPKNVEAIRKHIDNTEDDEPSLVLDLDEETFEDLPIIEPTKPSKPRVLSISRKSQPKKKSRLSKIADLAQSRGLDELEQFASKKLGVEDTDENSQDRF